MTHLVITVKSQEPPNAASPQVFLRQWKDSDLEPFTAHFTPCVEIGWRFRQEYWGRGITFAAACQAMQFAFSDLRLEQLVSLTTETNLRSRKLMERLGFTRDPADDFLHPSVEKGHPLRPHVLYRKFKREDGHPSHQ